MLEGHFGIICSREKRRVYCLEGSWWHKKRDAKYKKREDITILYVPSCYLNLLISENPKVKNWKLKRIMELNPKTGDYTREKFEL